MVGSDVEDQLVAAVVADVQLAELDVCMSAFCLGAETTGLGCVSVLNIVPPLNLFQQPSEDAPAAGEGAPLSKAASWLRGVSTGASCDDAAGNTQSFCMGRL